MSNNMVFDAVDGVPASSIDIGEFEKDEDGNRIEDRMRLAVHQGRRTIVLLLTEAEVHDLSGMLEMELAEP